MFPVNKQTAMKPLPVPTAPTSSVIRCATPMPETSTSVDNDDAWNPNAVTPRIEIRDDSDDWNLNSRIQRPVHWLENDSLKTTRMKIFLEERCNDILEFKEVIGDEVKVRDGRWTKCVPLSDVRAVLPKEVGDLVTVLTGPMAGVALKVKSIQGHGCTVRRPGKVLRKNETDPSFPITCLIQIFPYSKT